MRGREPLKSTEKQQTSCASRVSTGSHNDAAKGRRSQDQCDCARGQDLPKDDLPHVGVVDFACAHPEDDHGRALVAGVAASARERGQEEGKNFPGILAIVSVA